MDEFERADSGFVSRVLGFVGGCFVFGGGGGGGGGGEPHWEVEKNPAVFGLL